ncbi:hypothetical protein, partial [Methanoculleus sediminis]|uniref:hypothetical protein n=1 Tax=Methanoculleus sediminis TaxID=1550566 RepID=UPI0012E0BFA9
MALVALAILLTGMEARGAEIAPALPPLYARAIDQAKAEMLRDPALALRNAEAARRAAAIMSDPRQRTLALATADWLRGESAVRLGRDGEAEQ